LTKVDATTVNPGDHILVNADSTWNGQRLWPKGSGTAAAPIVLDFYATKDGQTVYTADTRPLINGNGLYADSDGFGTTHRYINGAVQLVNQEYWKINNLEVTNSPDLANQNAYKKSGDAQRAGILIMGYEKTPGVYESPVYSGIEVQNNYVHDVVSQNQNYASDNGDADPKLKTTGGIILLAHRANPFGVATGRGNNQQSTIYFDDIDIHNNVVQRVGLEGIRTKSEAKNEGYNVSLTNIKIRNNYLEDVDGDAIVLSEVSKGGLVESNITYRAAAADNGAQNYAANWAMTTSNSVWQYNESYGNVYGYNDAEAYDADNGCNNLVFQYNYSHHNGGGAMLFMSGQHNTTFRYNISANDGFGNKGTGVSVASDGQTFTLTGGYIAGKGTSGNADSKGWPCNSASGYSTSVSAYVYHGYIKSGASGARYIDNSGVLKQVAANTTISQSYSFQGSMWGGSGDTPPAASGNAAAQELLGR
jgi:hypothetical protein